MQPRIEFCASHQQALRTYPIRQWWGMFCFENTKYLFVHGHSEDTCSFYIGLKSSFVYFLKLQNSALNQLKPFLMKCVELTSPY